jgi:hypothetical protein
VTPREVRAAEFVPGVVLVGVSAVGARGGPSPLDAVLAQVGGTSAERLFMSGAEGVAARGPEAPTTEVYRVTLPVGMDVLTAVEGLKGSGVAFVEPDYLARAIPVERAVASVWYVPASPDSQNRFIRCSNCSGVE